MAPAERDRVRPDNQITGNIGLYFSCYKLSMLGWNVMPTSRNARGVDIIAYSRDATRFRGIQIKTTSKRNAVPLGNTSDKIMGDFWIVVNSAPDSHPSAYIFHPAEVLQFANRNEKEGKPSYWLEYKTYSQALYGEAWDRIGRGDI